MKKSLNHGLHGEHGENMDKKSILVRLRERLDTTLILFELILSVIFMLVGHLVGSNYLSGIGVGLIIAWVTSALAYFIAGYRKKEQNQNRQPNSSRP